MFLFTFIFQSNTSVTEEPMIHLPNPLLQRHGVAPSQPVQTAHIQQLPRRPVRLRHILRDPSLVLHHIGDHLRQLDDLDILTGPDVDVHLVRVVVHQEQAGVRQVVHVQELPPRLPRPPDHHLLRALHLRLVDLAYERRQHVRRLQVEVIVRAVQVRRHGGYEVPAVLPPVELAQLDPGDLRHRVRLVGLLQRTGQQVLLLDRLRRELRIDARATQEQQLLHIVLVRRVYDVRLDHQVVVDELRRVGAVGHDPAHLGRRQEHVLRAHLIEQAAYLSLVPQVHLGGAPLDDVGEVVPLQPAHYR